MFRALIKILAFIFKLKIQRVPLMHWKWCIWQAFNWWRFQPHAEIRPNYKGLVVITTINPSGKREYHVVFVFDFDEPPRVQSHWKEVDVKAPYCNIAGYLGVYHPDDGWLPELPFIRTMFPWTAEWYYFYEIWQITGEWVSAGSKSA